MKLFEHEGKELFARHGISVPGGGVASSPEQAASLASSLGVPVVVKAQVLSGKRGKRGGIAFADTPDEAGARASEILGLKLDDEEVSTVLVERKIDVNQEIYCSVTIDPAAGQPLLMVCSEGGVDIEEVAREKPGSVGRLLVDVTTGLRPFEGRLAARRAGISGRPVVQVGNVCSLLYGVFARCDAMLAEINPLVVTSDGKALAADSKVEIDDDALHRQQGFSMDGRIPGETDLERRARALGIQYVEFDGNIGVAGNGAGLMMTTLDLILKYGGEPANFVEAGGAAAEPGSGDRAVRWWKTVVELVLANDGARVLLFNLHGGNQRCDEVARGILEGLESTAFDPSKVVIRLSGTREEEGKRLIMQHGLSLFPVLEEAAREAVRLAAVVG